LDSITASDRHYRVQPPAEYFIPATTSILLLAKDILVGQPNIRAVTYEVLQKAIPVLGATQITQELKRLSAALDVCSAAP